MTQHSASYENRSLGIYIFQKRTSEISIPKFKIQDPSPLYVSNYNNRTFDLPHILKLELFIPR